MTTRDTADRTSEAIDFTMMYVTHDAFRRDLARFKEASAAGTAHTPGVRAGWENFKAQLLLHHSVEDTDLLAVWGPPAPGPDIVISVIARDSTVTALNGPSTEASGCAA